MFSILFNEWMNDVKRSDYNLILYGKLVFDFIQYFPGEMLPENWNWTRFKKNIIEISEKASTQNLQRLDVTSQAENCR